jgi:3-isopropylmalate/(R)-2-methylmalate dehydratase large subunit
MPDRVTVDYLWPFIGQTRDGPAFGGRETNHRTAGEDKTYAGKTEALADFEKWRSDDDAVYSCVVDIDCTGLEPSATVGYKPDQVKPIRELKGTKVDQVYIGSCTNGRIEDLREAAAVLKGRKIAGTVRAIVSPATPAVYTQALAEGIITVFMEAGFCVTNPTCGACLGMSNGVLAEGETCASTTNRNFYGRMGKGGMVHLMSPVSAAAAAVAGYIASPEDL